MSKYLSIEPDWFDQPQAADPLERRTWARIEINAAGRTATRLWDRISQAERSPIYIPAFPLAEWLVNHWWALLYEPLRGKEIPTADRCEHRQERAWLQRHCLRAADSGLLLSRLCFHSDGRGVVLQWFADDFESYPRMPGQFTGSGCVNFTVGEVEIGLRDFVSRVIQRIDGDVDIRAVKLQAQWAAIRNAAPDEAAFCRTAGRLGLDPYCLEEWPVGLSDLVESAASDASDQPLVSDFFEAAEPEMATDTWQWLKTASQKFDLHQAPPLGTMKLFTAGSPDKTGYKLARIVRTELRATGRLEISSAAAPLRIPMLSFENFNHLPSSRVRAVVGWQNGKQPTLAGPRPKRADNARFLEARSLFHAAISCSRGPRLVSAAYTWDQPASRAFAAELLAPQAKLAERFGSHVGADDVDERLTTLATEYQVSPKVIRHQLDNAGVDLGDD